MGLRFSKSLKIAPGLRINLGLRGVSATVGRKSASMTVGKTGTHVNAGIPGSGLSYRTRVGGSRSKAKSGGFGGWFILLLIVGIVLWIW